MKEIQAEPGMHINQAAKVLVSTAKTEGDCFLNFNDILLAANQFSTVEMICSEYDRLSELRQQEYQSSPEGKAMKARREAERQELQARADDLMTRLPRLNFSDVGYLLDWLCQMEEPRDRIGVTVDVNHIREVFVVHGYHPHDCEGDKFDANDPENVARWIIGQAIAETYVPMVRHFTEKWKAASHPAPLNAGQR